MSFEHSIYSQSYKNGAINGDIVCWRDLINSSVFFLFDGLGHGKSAAISSRRAADFFEFCDFSDPSKFLKDLHGHLSNRGCAGVGIAGVISRDKRNGAAILNYASTGDCWGFVSAKKNSRFRSRRGIIGKSIGSVESISESVRIGSCIVVCSDGVDSQLYGEFGARDRLNIHFAAKNAVTTFGKFHDDSTILIIKVLTDA